MGFYVLQYTAQDGLRALFVNSLNYNSSALGSYDLSNLGSFLRGSPVVAREKAAKKIAGEDLDSKIRAMRFPRTTESSKIKRGVGTTRS